MATPNPDFFNELVAQGGGDVSLCYQCGTCTAGCPSGRRTNYRTRKLMRMAQLGLKEDVLASEDLWQCSTCYTCVERCPRQVPIVDIIITLRNMAVAEGHMYANHKGTAKNLAKYGHTVGVKDDITKLRESLGLPANPPTVLSNPKAKADLDKILTLTGFDSITKEA